MKKIAIAACLLALIGGPAFAGGLNNGQGNTADERNHDNLRSNENPAGHPTSGWQGNYPH